ncbi:MAG TPA: DUF979 family protein, partial [Candidatus Aquilonibacter sp.]|nr:DUF979 family protein [Candidatus Aquilonibacter sp.]
MISADWIYWLCGALFFFIGMHIALDRDHPRRLPTALFWSLFGASLCYGSFVPRAPAWILGLAVITMALLAGFGFTAAGRVETTSEPEREEHALRLRNRLFIPALVIPAVTALISVGLGGASIHGRPLFAAGAATLVALGVATVLAFLTASAMLRPPPGAGLREGRRLLEAIGWAALLPQMLATLGLLFTQAGVGTQVGIIVQHVVPEQSRVAAVIVYALGMALFTVIMGNAF